MEKRQEGDMWLCAWHLKFSQEDFSFLFCAELKKKPLNACVCIANLIAVNKDEQFSFHAHERNYRKLTDLNGEI